MSEEERRQRLGYRKKRKKCITAQVVVIAFVLVIALLCSLLTMFFNKTYYVNYVEKSSVDYGVHLKANDFYEESFLGKDYAYIASLIDTVEASFNYEVAMQSENAVDFDYTYRVDSVVQIRDRYTSKVLYAPVYNEVAETAGSTTGKEIDVGKTVFIDYGKYNSIANSFINTYTLQNVDASLIVKLTVNVTGQSDQFHTGENSNTHVSSISLPLSSDTVEVRITSAAPGEEQKILSYTTKNISDIFKLIAIVAAILAVVLGIILWIYAYLSRNVDVTYDIKVAKILRSYKAFIQRIRNSFDTDGYQLLILDSFDEMLAIRDTIQSPILMEENSDKTCSRFFIPSNTEILYLYELKVDDYDRIYNTVPDEDEVIDEPIFEEAVEEEPIFEEVMVIEEAEPICEDAPETAEAEPICEDAPETAEAEPVPENDEIPAETASENVDEDRDDEEAEELEYIDESGNKIKIACNRSFTANLIQSNPQVKSYYSEIKNRLLSYRGVKARTSWRYESFNKGRSQLAKLKIRGKTICLYLALDPDGFEKSKYFQERTDAKCFASVPMMIRVRSDRGLKRALELIDAAAAGLKLSLLDGIDKHNYSDDYPYETTAALVERKLVKILLPGAVAAEPPAHHHVHKMITVVHEGVQEELTLVEDSGFTEEEITEIIEEPEFSLNEIDYDDSSEPVEEFFETEEDTGIDVIGVVWPEKPKRNKIYRYDPDGETVDAGDVVIVPTRDISRGRDVIRKAVVAHKNHKVSAESLTHPLKKIVGIIRHKDK